MDVQDRPADEALSPAAQAALELRAAVQASQTLSSEDSAKYRATVHFMRRVEGRERKWIANLLGISPSAVGKLLTRKTTATEGAAA